MKIPKNNFTVGQKVIVEGTGVNYMDVVSEITPKGFVKVRGNLYRPTDCETATLKTSDQWNNTRIYIPTDEDIKKLWETTTIRKCKNAMLNCKSLTYEQAVNILEILKEQ